jgi:hypothetical protein
MATKLNKSGRHWNSLGKMTIVWQLPQSLLLLRVKDTTQKSQQDARPMSSVGGLVNSPRSRRRTDN